LTDGRFSGGTSGLSIGHAAPEAAHRAARSVWSRPATSSRSTFPAAPSIWVSEHELTERRTEQHAKGWKPVEKRKRNVTTALKAYAAFASSADKGAVRILPEEFN
jgi:dihydroxy-acid dehydratase